MSAVDEFEQYPAMSYPDDLHLEGCNDVTDEHIKALSSSSEHFVKARRVSEKWRCTSTLFEKKHRHTGRCLTVAMRTTKGYKCAFRRETGVPPRHHQ